jgi:23S rRNA (uridine2552-2'-O)-methyltransferase
LKRREDYYTRNAREKGYPARSVFKLQEIQRKFHLIRGGDHVLDIGASPGSWSLYAVRELKAQVVGVDLEEPAVPLKDLAGLTFLLGDIFDESIGSAIVDLGPFDVVMNDAAPKTTGNRLVDTQRSFDLTERVLEISEACLTGGGNLVSKVFQGGFERELLERMKGAFRSARAFKPKSSRKESFETYLIGISKR